MARALLNFGCLRHCSPHDRVHRDNKIIKISFPLSKLVFLTNSVVDDVFVICLFIVSARRRFKSLVFTVQL